MKEFEKKSLNAVKRGAKRAFYDQDTVYQILDDGMICHLGYNMDQQPFVIPTAYGRIDNKIYVHGSVKSRTLEASVQVSNVSLCVTLLDGLVLARSAFHHSANYRSVVIFGPAREVIDDAEKNTALFAITESVLKGRWDEVRKPNQKELDITRVLCIEIDSASAKVRQGGPVDDKEDYELEVWAGELPLNTGFSKPVNDEKLRSGIPMSNSVVLACG